LGIFGNEKEIGKSITSDLQESKKTLLILKAFQKANTKNKSALENILNKNKITVSDLNKTREIIINSGSLEFSQEQIKILKGQAEKILSKSTIMPKQKDFLQTFSDKILTA